MAYALIRFFSTKITHLDMFFYLIENYSTIFIINKSRYKSLFVQRERISFSKDSQCKKLVTEKRITKTHKKISQ